MISSPLVSLSRDWTRLGKPQQSDLSIFTKFNSISNEQSTFELYNQAVGTIASSTGSAGSYLELDSMGNVGHCHIWIDSERPKGFEQLFQLE